MPRFDFNPADASSGIQIYPKGEYIITLGEATSFYAAGKNGKADNAGVIFRAKIAEGEKKGKPVMVRCYYHTQEARDYSKSIQMSALGYTPRKNGEDERFNKDKSGLDWTFNTDDKSCGEGWHSMSGQSIKWEADISINIETGEQQQKTLSYNPI